LAPRLLRTWETTRRLPFGDTLFGWLVGFVVPYSGSVSPRVRTLAPGHARVEIRDRRRLRQHLGSVHAIALMNVAELASGLAMLTALPPGVRGIVTRITIEYRKKARGVLTAESRATVPAALAAAEDHDFTSTVTDAAGDVVAVATVTWRLAPERPGA
jgi:acyl-coenzyme A thioesterase PaaI-like protein